MSDFLSKQPYKGSRDFFPDEMRSRTWMFNTLRQVVERFGYEEIDAPLLEPLDLYRAKTSEEIVNQQIYSFTDRGDRKVAIRPEMTPTVSRMVAQKLRETPKPIRWYCIPNLWRYERPGKGRLREHWQLNVDLFAAVNETEADIEILEIAINILLSFRAKPGLFKLYLNHRELLNAVFESMLKIEKEKWPTIARILDKKEKIDADYFEKMLTEAGLDQDDIKILNEYFDTGISFIEKNKAILGEELVNNFLKVLSILNDLGYSEFYEYNASVIRGFDYYTGLIFEIFDLHPDNRRSLFGGGRYNNLIGYFGKESANAVGFGMGDVTLEGFLRSHGLYKEFTSKSEVLVANIDENLTTERFHLANILRNAGLNVEVALTGAKLGKQLQEAEKKNIDIVIIQGSEEVEKHSVMVKVMSSREQELVSTENLIEFIKGKL